MKRILSMAFFALFLLPVASIADNPQPTIKIKGGATIFSGDAAFDAYDLTLNEGQKITLTLELGVRESTPPRRRVRFLQHFHTTAPFPTNTYNPDILIGDYPGNTDSRDTYVAKPAFKANNARYEFDGDANHANAWNKPVDVAIEAKHDDDAENDTFRIQIPRRSDRTGAAYFNHYLYINGTVIDDDTVDYVINPSAKSLTIAEGGSGSFKVKLDSVPSASVTVALTRTGDSDVTFTPASLTFTTTDWNTDQTVTVNVAEDDDAIAETATIKLAATGGNYDDLDENFTVNVTDPDTGGITVASSAIVIPENRAQGRSLSFKLNSAPLPNTLAKITLSSSDTGAATVGASEVQFTTSSWNRNSAVPIRPVNDADGTDETVTITLTPSSGYPGVAAVTKEVTIQDDDGGINISSGAVNVIEGPTGTDTFTVTLAAPPASSASFSVTSSDTSVATVSPTTLTFNTSAKPYNTAQTVTVTGTQDNDQSDETATITVAATSGYRASDATKSISVKDDDARLEVSSASVSFAEDSTGTFTVALSSSPPGNVTVTVTSGDTGRATVSPSSITFTSTDWDAETVTVTGVDDDDGTDDVVTITLDAPGTIPDATKQVSIQDDDGQINISSAAVNVVEESTATFTVTLGAKPKTNATFSVTSGDTGVVTVSPPTLTFSSTNYNDAQTVTLTGVDDNDQSDETATITIAATSGYRASNATKSISVSDDDARVEVSSAAVGIEEESTGTFTVALSAAPSRNVTVTVTSGDTSKATVSPSSITFTSSDYDAETVTVTTLGDDDGTDETVTITLDATGAIPDATKQITIEDDDGEIEVSAAAVEITEGGSAGTFTVTLDAEPKTSVTLNVTSGDSGAATVSPATLTFTSSNHETAQTVTVTPADDSDGLDESVTITLAVSSAGGYRAADATKTISVEDDDRSIELSSAAVDLTEGGSTGSFTVALETAPAAGDDATITVSSGDTAA
ncbi:MAG: hypothetical protein ISN28_10845, partial [Ectothiorhodospiraceae bacterium AqS1]|nr:hypothetical protein [Ectothiorhodospiraceae bacterium AqS1]